MCQSKLLGFFFSFFQVNILILQTKTNQTKNSYKGVWDRQVHMAILKMNNQQGPTAQHGAPCPKPHSSLGGRGGEPRAVSSTDDAGKTLYPHAAAWRGRGQRPGRYLQQMMLGKLYIHMQQQKKGSWILTSHHLQRTNSKWIKNLNMHVPLLSTQNHHNTVNWPHSNTK